MKKAPTLYTIYLQFTSEHLKRGLEFLEFLEKKLSGQVASKRIIIDNYLNKGETKTLNGIAIHGGNNSYREFSGWQVGINILRNKVALNNNDVILFANDTFFRNYDPEWIELFKPSHFRKASKSKVMVGWRGSFYQNMTFLNYIAFNWIRTNCFVINYGLLSHVQPLQVEEMACNLFSGQVNSFFSVNAPIGKEYKAYLRSWLFGDLQPGIQLTKSWYLSEPLSEENIQFFEQKAMSIICEHALSARVINNGGQLVFINELSLRKKLVKFKKRFLLIIHSRCK